MKNRIMMRRCAYVPIQKPCMRMMKRQRERMIMITIPRWNA